MQRLNATSSDFKSKLTALLQAREVGASSVTPAVSEIIAKVRAEGDAALKSYTKKFDGHENLALSKDALRAALKDTPKEIVDALKTAAKRIADYSEKQLPKDEQYKDDLGNMLGWRWTPIDSVGLYVPGGKAIYPSSVLMNAVPAKVAGVKRLVAVVPTPNGEANNALLAALAVAGIEEIYTVGGAQAVAALAYGTKTISPVDKIAGPGNAYVAEAKRQVFGKVGIDMIAGPSEILVIADGKQNASWIAADLLSQAEHDELAQSILITDSEALAIAVEKEVEALLKTLPRKAIAEKSWKDFGAIITVSYLKDAPEIANVIAPEHVELLVDSPDALMKHIHHAGAIFLGHYTPEAIGDYIAGPSHVLPTSQTARFASGLSVFDFLKRSSIIGCSSAGFNALAPAGIALADVEGLGAHALSMRIRRE